MPPKFSHSGYLSCLSMYTNVIKVEKMSDISLN